MTDPLASVDLGKSVAVFASAGTGKAWLLTASILRLLLAGAKPDSILAITFTRKAAAEIQRRLTERLVNQIAQRIRQIIDERVAIEDRESGDRAARYRDCMIL